MLESEKKYFVSCEENYGRESEYYHRSRRGILIISGTMIMLIITTNTLLLCFTVWSVRNPQQVSETPSDKNLSIDWDQINAEFSLNKSRQLPDHIDYYTQCDVLWDNITQLKYLHYGWSKIVYSGLYQNSSVAVKTIYFEGKDIQNCLETHTLLECYHRASSKMLREIILLSHLNSSYVLKVHAACIPEKLSKSGMITRNNLMVLVTDLGTPINLITLLQTPFDLQLKMVSDLSHLVSEFSHTALGSLTINDLRREQFVLVNSTLVLSDMDDVTRDDDSCMTNEDCANIRKNRSTPCIRGRCGVYINCHNSYSVSVHLLTPLLTGAPTLLQNSTEEIITQYSECLKSADQLEKDVEQLVTNFSRLTSIPDNYTVFNYTQIDTSDMAGNGDYRCKYSNQLVCSITAACLDDALYLCYMEPHCLTIVISNHRTWSGRLQVILKSSKPHKENLTRDDSMTVYHLIKNNSDSIS